MLGKEGNKGEEEGGGKGGEGRNGRENFHPPYNRDTWQTVDRKHSIDC